MMVLRRYSSSEAIRWARQPRPIPTRKLLDLVEHGDVQARSLLLARHRAKLRKMLAVRLDRRLLPRLNPSDAVQETLTEALGKLSDYVRTRPIPFYPWLRQLAGQTLSRLYEQHVLAGRRSVNREAFSMMAFFARRIGRRIGPAAELARVAAPRPSG